MAIDKLVDSSLLDSGLTSIANAIRIKGGTSASLAFPSGMVQAIDDISTGESVDLYAGSDTPSGASDGDMWIDSSADGVDYIAERKLGSIITGNASYIGSYAFNNCRSLTTVSFPACTSIGSNAFYKCSALTSVLFPACTSIEGGAFYNCTSLTTASFPACTTIQASVFQSCVALTSVSFPVCTAVGSYAFYSCTSLTTVSFPVCTNIASTAFRDCFNLTSVSFPVCTNIERGVFQFCTALTSVSFPVCTAIRQSVFQQCTALTTASFPVCMYIESNAFSNCRNLLSLYLLGSSVPTLYSTNAFASTPISGYTASTGGVYGSIIVQESMLSAFKAAANWSIYSSRFSVWNGVD